MFVYYTYNDGTTTSTHKITASWSKSGAKRKLEIFVSAGTNDQAARLWGTIQGTEACLEHMEAGRFPTGRGIGYLMLSLFAERLLEHCNPEPNVCLGSPVNHDSVNKAAERGENVNGERAAVHIYQLCGFNVATAETAILSQVSASDLRDRLAPKLQRWSKAVGAPA